MSRKPRQPIAGQDCLCICGLDRCASNSFYGTASTVREDNKTIRKELGKTYRVWTADDISAVVALTQQGTQAKVIAHLLDRTLSSVYAMIKRLRKEGRL